MCIEDSLRVGKLRCIPTPSLSLTETDIFNSTRFLSRLSPGEVNALLEKMMSEKFLTINASFSLQSTFWRF